MNEDEAVPQHVCFARKRSGDLCTVAAWAAKWTNVVLLHGLGRTASSMSPLANGLAGVGYRVCNVSYPSRGHGIEELTLKFVLPAISERFKKAMQSIHFVTHSLGGVIVRQLAASVDSIAFGRVVMLAPPNGGSPVVDKLGDWRLFKLINGPAGRQLGTKPHDLPRSLGPASFELGVIAGNRSINPILSTMIEGENDGRFSIESTKLEGMKDFLVVPVSHTLIMRNDVVREQVIHFLEHGRFRKAAAPVSS